MHAAQQLDTVHPRHVYVTQQHINIGLFELAQGGLPIWRDLYAVTVALQLLLQNQAQVGFVFRD